MGAVRIPAKTVTTLIFQVRNLPAALYKALGGFATNGVNMTKLESYMVDGHFSATMFYSDVEGHPDDPALKRALDELAFFSKEMKILGVYPAHEFRDSFPEPGGVGVAGRAGSSLLPLREKVARSAG
jgi:prephenate dehydratase